MKVYSVIVSSDDYGDSIVGPWVERWAAENYARTGATKFQRRQVVEWQMLNAQVVQTYEPIKQEDG